MTAIDSLDLFVKEGLSAGRSRQELDEALSRAGWTQREIRKALSKYADTEFTPPVPRPAHTLTARHTFLYALLFVAMAFTASYLVVIVHQLIDLQLPDIFRDVHVSPRRLRWAAAMLIVWTPVFMFMSYYVAHSSASDDSIRKSPVRKWLTYLALFVSALILLGDGVYTINQLLQGDLTVRFVLKAATVAVVAAVVFYYYLRDAEETSDEG